MFYYKFFRVIWLEHGIKEFYRGIVPILYRNGPSNACFFILREEADRLLPKRVRFKNCTLIKYNMLHQYFFKFIIE